MCVRLCLLYIVFVCVRYVMCVRDAQCMCRVGIVSDVFSLLLCVDRRKVYHIYFITTVFLLSIAELLSDVSQHFNLGSDGCHSFEGADCEEAWGEHGHVRIISTSASVVRMAG